MLRSLSIVLLFLLLSVTVQAKGLGFYKSLSEALQEPEKVRVLKLSYQFLDSLPDIFHRFVNLEELILNNNRLESLPPSIFLHQT